MTEEEIKALQETAAAAAKAAQDAQERLEKLEANNKALLAEKLEAKRQAEEAALQAAKKSGDLESYEKSINEKHQKEIAELMGQIKTKDSLIDGVTRGATAATIAADIFGTSAKIMKHHVESRLRTEIIDGKPQVRVLDAAGNLTALSVDDLKNEFRNNADFAPFVVGSKASGGHPANRGGGGDSPVMARSQFEAMQPVQKAKFMKEGGKLIDG